MPVLNNVKKSLTTFNEQMQGRIYLCGAPGATVGGGGPFHSSEKVDDLFLIIDVLIVLNRTEKFFSLYWRPLIGGGPWAMAPVAHA